MKESPIELESFPQCGRRNAPTALHRISHIAARALLGWLACLSFGPAGPADAGPADVLSAKAQCSAARQCAFDVTVKHADEGWKHYADRWEIVGPDGKVLATRVLRHPHVDEQPFTRRLPRTTIPSGVAEVVIRAHDSVHGLGGAEVRVEIPE